MPLFNLFGEKHSQILYIVNRQRRVLWVNLPIFFGIRFENELLPVWRELQQAGCFSFFCPKVYLFSRFEQYGKYKRMDLCKLLGASEAFLRKLVLGIPMTAKEKDEYPLHKFKMDVINQLEKL